MKRTGKIWRVMVFLCIGLCLLSARPLIGQNVRPVPISAAEYNALSAIANTVDASNMAEIRSGNGLILVLAVVGIVVIAAAIIKNKRPSEIL